LLFDSFLQPVWHAVDEPVDVFLGERAKDVQNSDLELCCVSKVALSNELLRLSPGMLNRIQTRRLRRPVLEQRNVVPSKKLEGRTRHVDRRVVLLEDLIVADTRQQALREQFLETLGVEASFNDKGLEARVLRNGDQILTRNHTQK